MRPFFIVLVFLSLSRLQAQDYWKNKTNITVDLTKRSIGPTPHSYQVFELQNKIFRKLLNDVPLRGESNSKSELQVFFPMADGSLRGFYVTETPVFDAELSEMFPDIKSYAGQGIDDPSEILRFSVSHKGIKGMLFSSSGYEFIEPYTEDRSHYMVYKRRDRQSENSKFECSVTATAKQKINQDYRNNADDGTLRTYRLAVSTNGEYTAYHGGTVADALAAINNSMTRVNGIFEIDFNVTMSLISATTNVIYTNANTDPYSNSSGQWNSELQTTLTNVIGEEEYDIGHLFAQGSNNGNAGCIGCVCVDNQKGSGFTSRSIPEGDPFDVDYIAHEIGHQFGGNHTWTFGGNEGTNVQMEPGSGSTIMGYAGITNEDVQDNSDPYFHAVSIEQITNYVKTTSCQLNTATGNNIPTVEAGDNKTIPHGTPFILSGTSTDTDGDVLTYCWEQMDENNAATSIPSTSATTGVAFRSISPTTSTDRIFPDIETVIGGATANTWEVVPDVARTLNFRLTVRDNIAGGGTNESDDLTLTVDGNSGPFKVTSQNTTQSYLEGQSVDITWDVANTDTAPVSCSNVDIFLSYDGGFTYPVTLISNVPNDGSQSVSIPTGISSTARVMVKCSDNYFFDINDTNFEILNGSPTYFIDADPSIDTVCEGDNSYTINVVSSAINGFSTPINIQVHSLPSGTSASITNNPLTPGQSTTIEITGLSSSSGSQIATFRTSAGSIIKPLEMEIIIIPEPNIPVLLTPTNGDTEITTLPELSWSDVDADSYIYEVGSSEGANDVASGSTTETNVYLSSPLSSTSLYFWRVKALNSCGESDWSIDHSFTTKSCETYIADDLPISIPTTASTIVSSLPIRDRGTVNDIQVLNLTGTHTWVRDLRFTVTNPTGSSVRIWNRPCNNEDDFNINFDDQAAAPHTNVDCPPTAGLTYQPDNPLSSLIGSELKGTWTMTVRDLFDQDGGALNTYNLEFCFDDFCDLTVTKAYFDTQGSISSAINCAVDGDTIWLENIIPSNMIDIQNNGINIDKSITIVGDVRTEIRSQSAEPLFTISDGKTVSLIDIDIVNETGLGILNNGNLILVNINISTPNNSDHVKNSSTGKLTLEGDCTLE